MPSKKSVNLCTKCHQRQSSLSGIVKGVYYKNLCTECLNESSIVSSGDARWQRSLDAEDHEAEIQQPYLSDGTINTRFAKLYPKQASALFTEKEIRDANH